MVIRRVRTDGQRKPMPLHNGHDFHAFTALRVANLVATAFRRDKGGVNEAFRLIERPFSRRGLAKSTSTFRKTSLRHHCWKRRCTVF